MGEEQENKDLNQEEVNKNEVKEENNGEVQEEKQDKSSQDYEELNDRYMRVLAEFENFKKRSLKERESLYNSILGDIILKILPLMDNLEIALKAECKDENYKQGVELVQKQFKEFLDTSGVQAIPALGETFDPGLHEAVSSVQDETKEHGIIVQEFRKGYKIGTKVIRHSIVVVNN